MAVHVQRGFAPIHCAACNNKIDAIKILLDFTPHNPDFSTSCHSNQLSNYGQTPLHIACLMGNYEAVNFLLSEGANLDLVDKDKNTFVHYVSVGDDMILWSWAMQLLKDQFPHLVEERNKVQFRQSFELQICDIMF